MNEAIARTQEWPRSRPLRAASGTGSRQATEQSKGEERKNEGMLEEQRGLYIISVAARLLDMHPQTLRKYERAGFLTPNRTGGMLRLYSAEDIARLQLIKHLVDDLGLNLSGVELGLELASLVGEMEQALEGAKDFDELRNRLRASLLQARSLLGLPPRQGPERHPRGGNRGL